MTMRRILQCVLVSVALTTFGCSLFETESETPKNSSSPTAADNRKKIDFSDAEGKVRDGLRKLKPSTGTGTPDSKVNQVQADIKAALNKLNLDNDLVSACDCLLAIEEAKGAQSLLTTVATTIGTRSEKISELDIKLKDDIQSNLERAADKLHEASRLAAIPPRASASASVTATSSAGAGTSQNTTPTWDLTLVAAKVAGGLLVLALIGMGLLSLRNQSRHRLETYLGKAATAQVSATREAQKELLDKLSSLATAQNDTNTRLHEVHTEIRSLARLTRESSPNRGDGRIYASLASPSYTQNDPSPPKEEPEFPVSAVDYLGKMTRFSNVVRPDFQNGILVNDPDGIGELMLIRDSRLPDETQPLFVIPRNTQFQTKQDFYTYYEKYYDCSRPSAGDVWIIDPAVVERVSGGWQLREKGVLEIR